MLKKSNTQINEPSTRNTSMSLLLLSQIAPNGSLIAIDPKTDLYNRKDNES